MTLQRPHAYWVLLSLLVVALSNLNYCAAQTDRLLPCEDTFVTRGDTLYLTANKSIVGVWDKATRMLWSNGDTGWTLTIVPAKTQTVRCTLTTTEDTYVDSLTVYAIDYKPVITSNCSKLIVSEPILACQWLLQGKPVLGATNNTYQPTEAGSYTVTVVDKKGRVGTSKPMPIKEETDISLLSDPDNNRLIINRIDVSKVVIWNDQGDEVMQVTGTPKISLERLPEGRYDIAVWLGGCFAKRFRVVKANR